MAVFRSTSLLRGFEGGASRRQAWCSQGIKDERAAEGTGCRVSPVGGAQVQSMQVHGDIAGRSSDAEAVRVSGFHYLHPLNIEELAFH